MEGYYSILTCTIIGNDRHFKEEGVRYTSIHYAVYTFLIEMMQIV